MVSYLVTGGAGFVGSNIVETLLKKGARIKVIDNFSTGKRENIKEFIHDIELIEGDITDYKTVEDAVSGTDIIFHQGAVPSVPKSVKNPIRTNNANVTGTIHLLHAAVKQKVSRFIYAASSSAYGDTKVLPKREDMPANPMSPYAISKHVGELYCRVFYQIYGLETISLRYFNVFGPKQDPLSEYAAVIPKFISSILKEEAPTIFGDGNQSRDFTFIENVIHANLLAANADRLNGEVVNIGSGKRTDLNKLLMNINEMMGTNLKAEYKEDRPGDVKHSLADIAKAEKIIGYKPIIPFEKGLKHTLDWYQKKGEA
ncbi:SDR family oxidoreductase [Evansella tamaricis]|uniref:SDR family oxidoreductase n=1 Tax=Evansella tamaricis TaxID=2069301 RepID=A0ABS6JIG6_9BACI|nr:SDR family oxidoreductase [Evansella tamaricis]MBU9713328.1 SDR family oxidoreductase [Evansella tamaricis]